MVFDEVSRLFRTRHHWIYSVLGKFLWDQDLIENTRSKHRFDDQK